MIESERMKDIKKQIEVARAGLAIIERDELEYHAMYAKCVEVHAATMNIITTLQWYRGYQSGSQDTRKIYTEGK